MPRGLRPLRLAGLAYPVSRSPASYGEEIRTYVWPAELKRSSIRLGFEMRVEGDDRLVAGGWGTLVGYDYGSGRAQPIPDEFRALIEPSLVG